MRKRRKLRRLESLESRQLMAADIDLIGGVLEIVGTDAPEQIVIESQAPTSGGAGVIATVTDLQSGEVTSQTFSLDEVQEIKVEAGDGDDEVTNNTPFNIAAYGEGGNDTLRGGIGRDFLNGGTGDDLPIGAAGDDALVGRAGNDILTGGDDIMVGDGGSDLMYGGDGNDNIHGRAGRDVMYGGDGDDELRGGDGRDSLYGEGGADLVDGGYDGEKDRLRGGSGADTFVRHVKRSPLQLEADEIRDWESNVDQLMLQWH